MAPLNTQDAFDVLKKLESINIWHEVRDGGQIVGFSYMTWDMFRRKAFGLLRKHTQSRHNMSKARRAELSRIVSAFAGSKKDYERRTRKITYAKLMDGLRAACPAMERDNMELIAGAILTGCKRNNYWVNGDLTFNPQWDTVTIREIVKFRRHSLPIMAIQNVADLERHVLRHLDTIPLSSHRLVKRYVLQRRHFARYYDSPDAIRAIDSSFKYTGSAYAFEKATAYKDQIELALLMPEVFFKKAGQKVRERKYAGWLRDQFVQFADIGHSVQAMSKEEVAAIQSWSELEWFSREWHAREVVCAIDEAAAGYSGKPFDFPVEVPRTIEHNGYTFTLLVTPKDIAGEGAAMRHCLTSYIPRVRKGSYLAFRVAGKDGRATLGIALARKQWIFDQVRGKYNARVPEDLHTACVSFALSLNYNALQKAA